MGKSGGTGSPEADQAQLERELDALLAKAGADVPADRKAGIVAGYRDMRRLASLLRQPMTAADEPSNIFRLEDAKQGRRA